MSQRAFSPRNYNEASSILMNLIPNGIYVYSYTVDKNEKKKNFYFCSKFEFKKLADMIKKGESEGFPKKGRWGYSTTRDFFNSIEETDKIAVSDELIESLLQTETLNQIQNVQNKRLGLLPIAGILNREILKGCFSLMMETIIARLTMFVAIPKAESTVKVQKEALDALIQHYKGGVNTAYDRFFSYLKDELVTTENGPSLGSVINEAFSNFFQIMLDSQLTPWIIDVSRVVDFTSVCDWMTGCLRNTKLKITSGMKLLLDSLINVRLWVNNIPVSLISDECTDRYVTLAKDLEVVATPELNDVIMKISDLSKLPSAEDQIEDLVYKINGEYGILRAEILADKDTGESKNVERLNQIIETIHKDDLLTRVFKNQKIDHNDRLATLVKLESTLIECMEMLTGEKIPEGKGSIFVSVSNLIKNLNVQVDKELQISTRLNTSMSESDKLLKLRYISVYMKVCYQRAMVNSTVATKTLSDAISSICDALPQDSFKHFIDFSMGIAHFITTNNLNAKTISDLMGRVRGYFLESYYKYYTTGQDEDCSKQKNLRAILKEAHPELNTRELFRNTAFSLLKIPDDYIVGSDGDITLIELGWSVRKQEKSDKDIAKWVKAKDILREAGISFSVKSYVVSDNLSDWSYLTKVITKYDVGDMTRNFTKIFKIFQTMRKVTSEVLSTSSSRLEKDFSKFPNIKVLRDNNDPSITENDILEAKKHHVGPTLARLPKSCSEWMESWIMQNDDLKVRRTVEKDEEYVIQEAKYVDMKGKQFLLCDTKEEKDIIELVDRLSSESCRYEECSEETAKTVVKRWREENKKKSDYYPSYDPGLQVPIPDKCGGEKRDSLPKFLKRSSVYNLILSEVPFPKRDFKHIKKDDLAAFKKYTRKMASDDSAALKLSKIVGRNSKVNLARHSKHTLSGEQFKLYKEYCSEYLTPKDAERLSQLEVDEITFKKMLKDETLKTEFDKLIAEAKKLNDEVDRALKEINPVWHLSPNERLEELDRRCENSDYQATKGEMIRPRMEDLQNVGEFIDWLKTIVPDENCSFVEESLKSVLMEKTVIDAFRESDTLTNICCDVIEECIKLVSKHKFAEILLLLKDIGDAYIKCKTESLTAGKFFVVDLEHFPVQMVVCMTTNSTAQSETQMCCLISDGKFISLNCRKGMEVVENCSHRFYMDLRLAKLYESLFAQLLSISLLICQTERKVKLKTKNNEEDGISIDEVDFSLEMCDTDELESCLVDIFSSCLMFTAKNDKNANEMIQNYRYIIMTFMNDYVSPDELGKKLSVNVRSSIAYEMMGRLQEACKAWGKLREAEYLEEYLRPMSFNHPIEFPSLTRKCKLKSIHSVVTEMYMVHLFCIDGSSLANSTTKVFNKSLESQVEFEREVQKENGESVVLGNDLSMVGDEFLENCKAIIDCPSSVCSYTGKGVHDAGLLLNKWMKDSNKSPDQDVTKLNVGFSTLSGTSSIVKKPVRVIDLDDCRVSVKKQEIIRYIKVGKLNETSQEIEEKVRLVTKNFPSESNFDSENFTKNYLKNNSQTFMTNQEIEDYFNSDFINGLPDYERSIVCLKWLFKMVNKTRGRESENHAKEPTDMTRTSKKLSGIVSQPSTVVYAEDVVPDKKEISEFLECVAQSYTGVDKEILTKCYLRSIDTIRKVASTDYMADLKKAEREFLALRDKQQKKPHLNMDEEIREKSLKIDGLVNKIIDPLLKLLFMESSLMYSRYTLKESDMGCVNNPGGAVQIALRKHIGKIWKGLSTNFSIPLKILSEFVNNVSFFDVLTRGNVLNIDERGKLDEAVFLGLNLHMSVGVDSLWTICLEQIFDISSQRLEESLSTHNLKKKFWQISTSLRTKVILELIDQAIQRGGLGGEFNSSIQLAAEELITTKEMEFFGIAPKEQLGSIRELGIQSFKTKITNHMSEMIARTVNRKVTSYELTESLSHVESKYYKVDDAITEIKSSKAKEKLANRNGKVYEGYCIALNKDHSKWGPTHCPGGNFRFFLHGLGDALGKFQEYMDLKMVSGSSKDVEIPRAVIIKQAKLPKDLDIKNETDALKLKTRSILEGGKQVVGKYQDMIQGIHHHLSSTNAMGVQLMCHRWMKMLFLRHGIRIETTTTQGSDDELSLLIVMSIFAESELSESKKEEFGKKAIEAYRLFEKLLNFKTSPKSTYGTIIVEFNQIFSIYEANIPTCIKYCSSQFFPLNCTNWNELVSMTYSSCQQALYMGVPYVNVVLMSLKQYSYYTRLTLMGEGGRNNLGYPRGMLPTCLGGIRVPSRANLLSDDLSSLELRLFVEALSENEELEWMLGMFDPPQSDADISEFLDKERSPFKIQFKRLELNEMKKVRVKLYAAKSNLEEHLGVETPLSFFRKNVETLRTPLSYYADVRKMISIIGSNKIENSFVEKSTASSIRMMKALYRGHYGIFRSHEFLSFPDLVDLMKETKITTQLRTEFERYQQSVMRTDVTGRSETLKQLSDQEKKAIRSCEVDYSDRCCWKEISISSTQTIVTSDPATILELCVVDEACEVPIQGPRRIQTIETDVETAKELCKTEIADLVKYVKQDFLDDEAKNGIVLLSKRILSILKKAKGRFYKIFGVGERSDTNRLFIEAMLGRNTIRGMNFKLRLAEFGVLGANKVQNLKKLLGIICLIFKLVSPLDAVNFLKLIDNDPSIVGLPGKTLKIELTHFISMPNLKMQVRQQALSVLSLLGDPTANQILINSINREKDGCTITQRGSVTVVTTCLKEDVAQSFIAETGSCHFSTSFLPSFLNIHFVNVKIEMTRGIQQSAFPKELLYYNESAEIGFTTLERTIFYKKISDGGILLFFKPKDGKSLLFKQGTIDFIGNEGFENFIVRDLSLKMMAKPERKIKEGSTINTSFDGQNLVTSYYDVSDQSNQQQRLLQKMELKKSLKSYSDAVGKDTTREIESLDKMIDTLKSSVGVNVDTKETMLTCKLPTFIPFDVANSFINALAEKTRKLVSMSDAAKKSVEPSRQFEPEVSEGDASDDSESSISASTLKTIVESVRSDAVSERVQEKKGFPEIGNSTLDSLDEKRIFSDELSDEFLRKATKKDIENAAYFLRRVEEDKEITRNEWTERDAIITAGALNGVSFEEMSNMSRGETEGLRTRVSWETFLRKRGFKSSSIEYVRPTMVLFDLKFPRAGNWLYEVLYLMANKDEFSFARLCMSLLKKLPQLTFMIEQSIGKAGESNPARSVETVSIKDSTDSEADTSEVPEEENDEMTDEDGESINWGEAGSDVEGEEEEAEDEDLDDLTIDTEEPDFSPSWLASLIRVEKINPKELEGVFKIILRTLYVAHNIDSNLFSNLYVSVTSFVTNVQIRPMGDVPVEVGEEWCFETWFFSCDFQIANLSEGKNKMMCSNLFELDVITISYTPVGNKELRKKPWMKKTIERFNPKYVKSVEIQMGMMSFKELMQVIQIICSFE